MLNKLVRNVLLVASLCLMCYGEAFAEKEQPLEVRWVGKAYNATADYAAGNTTLNPFFTGNNDLEEREILEEVASIVQARLKALAAAGELPFTFSEGGSDALNRNDWATPNYVAFVPVITCSSVFKTDHYFAQENKTCQKAMIITGLDLMFCYDPGPAKDLRILYYLPLFAARQIGSNGEYVNAVPYADLRRAFMANIREMVGQAEFKRGSMLKKIARKKQDKEDLAYQVTDVYISSSGARSLFGKKYGVDRGEALIKNIVAYAYTSAYARAYPKEALMPPCLAETKWLAEVEKDICSDYNFDAGKHIAKAEAYPERQIRLNLQKLYKFEIPIKKKYKVNLYKQEAYGAVVKANIGGYGKVRVGDFYVEIVGLRDDNPNTVNIVDLTGTYAWAMQGAAQLAVKGKKE